MERPWRSEFVRGTRQVNGIENFWSYAKERLGQFHGSVPEKFYQHSSEKFYWHLEECEYRFKLRKNHL
jgi:hypothetical protein